MKAFMKYFVMILIVFSPLACSFGGKPSVMVDQYALEYPPPSVQGLTPMDEVIRLERFSVAQIFNHVKMVYRQKPTHYNDYAYHRWRANPGDMVGDSLLRDLRAAGIFKSVFSWRDMANTSLILKGGVGEFYESDEKDGRKAILSVHIAVIDAKSRELTKQIIFQKNYRYEEPVTEKTVQGFAQAMSRAVERLSGQVITDIREAKNR
jgi:ABC-type uncharacterized transport system auxiliary subunit